MVKLLLPLVDLIFLSLYVGVNTNQMSWKTQVSSLKILKINMVPFVGSLKWKTKKGPRNEPLSDLELIANHGDSWTFADVFVKYFNS